MLFFKRRHRIIFYSSNWTSDIPILESRSGYSVTQTNHSIWRSLLMSILTLVWLFLCFLQPTSCQLHESRIKNEPFYSAIITTSEPTITIRFYCREILKSECNFCFCTKSCDDNTHILAYIFCSVCGQRLFIVRFQFWIDSIDTTTLSSRVFGMVIKIAISTTFVHVILIFIVFVIGNQMRSPPPHKTTQKKRLNEKETFFMEFLYRNQI